MTLRARPDQYSVFSGWFGGDVGCSGTGDCVITMDGDKKISAAFDRRSFFLMNITRGGPGAGSVVSSPAGIDCGSVCTADFPSDAVVTLTATAAPDSTFTGWTGDCSGAGICQLTMNSDHSVMATFGPVPPPDLSLDSPAPIQIVVAGQPAHFTISLVGNYGFTGTVSFACTAALPPMSACSFSPATVTAGAEPVSTTLSITTTGRSVAALQVPSRRNHRPLLALCLPVIGLVLAPFTRRGALVRRWHVGTTLPLLLLLVAALAGCGDAGRTPSTTGTPAGTYSLTVTATSGSISHTQAITLVVD